MTDLTASVERTYGGWRRLRSVGLGPLGQAGTIVLFAGMVLILPVMAFLGVLAAIPIVAVVAVIEGPLLLRGRDGRTGLQKGVARAAWYRGHMAGAHLYRSGPLSRIPHGASPLPGLGAKLEALDALDSYGRPFALLHHPTVGHVMAVLSTAPDGAALVDTDQVDLWVAHWGAFLAALPHEAGLIAAQVTIEAAPDPGTALRREVITNLHPDAPTLARNVLTGIVASYPAGSAKINSWVTLTWSTTGRTGRKGRTPEELAVEIGQRLPGLAHALASTGAGPATPVSTSQLASVIRVAYDPAAHARIDEAGWADTDIRWTECGPMAAEESWDRYRHDSGLSTSWQMSEAPRGLVYSSVLRNLLAPHPDIARKRVSLLYRPHTPAEATKAVRDDYRNARFAAAQRKLVVTRDHLDIKAAEQADTEEAQGAGVTRFGMVVTATVTDPAKFDAAVSAVDMLATTSRLELRRSYGSQASSFIAGLPLGMVLNEHLKVPQSIREAL